MFTLTSFVRRFALFTTSQLVVSVGSMTRVSYLERWVSSPDTLVSLRGTLKNSRFKFFSDMYVRLSLKNCLFSPGFKNWDVLSAYSTCSTSHPVYSRPRSFKEEEIGRGATQRGGHGMFTPKQGSLHDVQWLNIYPALTVN